MNVGETAWEKTAGLRLGRQDGFLNEQSAFHNLDDITT
jgi:hypothetical protein